MCLSYGISLENRSGGYSSLKGGRLQVVKVKNRQMSVKTLAGSTRYRWSHPFTDVKGA